MRILLVDDDRELIDLLAFALKRAGLEPLGAHDAASALRSVDERRPDLVVLDINLGASSGLEVLKELRRRDSSLPVIMLTALDSEEDKVRGLESGADDYLTKPFSGAELLARIRAALRRSTSGRTEPAFEAGNLRIDFVHRRVTRGGREIALTPKEYDVLKYLVTNVDRVITHTGILRAVWGPEYGDASPYLRNIIHSLRRKIEPVPDDPMYIRTEPGAGYRFDPGPAR